MLVCGNHIHCVTEFRLQTCQVFHTACRVHAAGSHLAFSCSWGSNTHVYSAFTQTLWFGAWDQGAGMKLSHVHEILMGPPAHRGPAGGCSPFPSSVLAHHSVLPLSPGLAQHSHRYWNKGDIKAMISDTVQCTELAVYYKADSAINPSVLYLVMVSFVSFRKVILIVWKNPTALNKSLP